MQRLSAATAPVIAHFRSARPRVGHIVRQGLAAIAIFIALSDTAWSAEGAGTIKTVSGSATVIGASSALRLPIAEGQRVYAGDRIASGPGSYVGIMLNDDTRLTIGPGSELVIREFEFTPVANTGGFWVAFLRGTAKVVTGLLATYSPERVLFTTPSGKIGVRGTEFVLDLEPQ